MIEISAIPENKESELASHLGPLSGGRWALWRTLAVRGAGFPAIDVLKLGDPTCGAATDRVLAAEAELQKIRSSILENLKREIKLADKQQRRALDKTMRLIKQGQLPELAETRFAELADATQRLESLTKEFHSAFSLTLNQTSRAIRELAGDERFQ